MKQHQAAYFVIYSRKSKVTGKGESVENQIEMCRQYIAHTYGQQDADDALIYEDEGFSGGNMERPQFKQMMQDSHTHRFAAIVVYRLDRISRNISDFAQLIEELAQRNIQFISIREQFDTSSPMGRAMMYIASVFSQLERETIAERIRDNMHELAKTGRWLGGNTPTGYMSEGVSTIAPDGKVHRSYKLTIIPEEALVVKKIYALFIQTGSLTKVDQYLLTYGYKTKRQKNFTRFAIRSILTNPVYLIADQDAYDYLTHKKVDLFSAKDAFDASHGVMVYNRTSQHSGRANQLNPMDQWIAAVGRHIGIIPGSTWVSVQDRLEQNKGLYHRTPKSNVALLSGILRCKNCGDYMRPKMTSRTTADGQPIYTYMCATKERSRRQLCSIKNINGNILDEKVLNVLSRLDCSSKKMLEWISSIKKQLRENESICNQELIGIQTQLDNSQLKINTLVDALADAASSSAAPYILSRINTLDCQCVQLRKQLQALESSVNFTRLSPADFEAMQRNLANFADCVGSYSLEQKRTLVHTCIDRIVWDGQCIDIYLKGCPHSSGPTPNLRLCPKIPL